MKTSADINLVLLAFISRKVNDSDTPSKLDIFWLKQIKKMKEYGNDVFCYQPEASTSMI